MANIKIAQLTNATTISDSDIVLIEDATQTKKMTVATLKELLGINAKANKTQPSWVSPALLNAWTNFGTPFSNCQYYKDDLGIVTIRGIVKGGAIGTAIFMLGTEYKPMSSSHFPTVSNGAFGDILITNLGEVIANVGDNGWFSIECQFRAGI